jgi:hypothetical protein
MKPILLETKVAKSKDFYKLSKGFQKLFTKDNQDRKMRLPISGYGGHMP